MDQCSGSAVHRGGKILNYLSKLNQEEINRLCEIFPYDIVKRYFSINSKQFAKILPGFRPKSLTETKVKHLLKQHYKKHFISSFIENNVKIWLSEIEEAINEEKKNRQSEFAVYIIVLAQSFFSNNVSAYFKLIESNYSEEKIALISDMVTELFEINKQTDKLKKVVEEDQKSIEALSNELDKCEIAIHKKIKAEKRLKQLENKIEKLNKELVEAKNENHAEKATIEKIQTENNSLKAKNKDIKNQIKTLEKGKNDLLKEISEGKYVKKLSLESVSSYTDITAPIDENGFEDSLSCNFIDLGLDKEFNYPNMLAVFLYKSICCGKPLIIKKQHVHSLLKCLSNTLVGNQLIDSLVFEPSIDENDIITFLSNPERIVLLDNFIGNYNETVLFNILEKYKNKIVFLSTSYDGTIKYISKEIFDYCTYISLAGLSCFEDNRPLHEPSSSFEETIVNCTVETNIYTRRFEKICAELSITSGIESNGKRFINDEISFVGYIYFSLVPYCINVININPFSHSSAFQKQFGENGRSKYKELFKKWYINE